MLEILIKIQIKSGTSTFREFITRAIIEIEISTNATKFRGGYLAGTFSGNEVFHIFVSRNDYFRR